MENRRLTFGPRRQADETHFVRLIPTMLPFAASLLLTSALPTSAQEQPAQPTQPAQPAQQQASPQLRPAVPRAAAPSPATSVKRAPGSVGGKVTTIDGTPLVGANVDVVKVGSPHKRFETKTDKDGNFTFDNLEPGDWRISYSAAGMLSAAETITILSGQKLALSEEMEDIEASDVLRVTGERTLIHPENTGTRTNLDRDFLKEYGTGNDLRRDIETAPGIIRDSLGNIITRGEHNAVNYEIDGVILPETGGVLNQAQFANPRSLESMTVDIGGYQARDGGGPLGAVVRMRSLPIPEKPVFTFGGQLGGPLAGSLTYYTGGALSQDRNSILNRVRIESSGTAVASRSLGIEPPSRRYVGNGRCDLNFLSKVEFAATEKDRLRLIVGLNETFMRWPTNRLSGKAGVRIHETDREDYIILGYRRLGEKWFDEANLNIVNSFYSTKLRSRNVFDPAPVLVGEEPLLASTAANAKRFNYVLSVQGEVKKRYREQHNVAVGFLSEIRPVRTNYSAFYYNIVPPSVPVAVEEAAAEGEGAEGEEEAAAEAAEAPEPLVPYGALISPFTGTPFGPQFLGNMGNYKGFRYLQSAYVQDAWRPTRGVLKRLSLDAGVRFDLYHGVFGNTLRTMNAILQVPDVAPFDPNVFKTQRVTNAQVSGRFGGAFAITNNTILRGSFAQIFQPPPVDLFATPFNVTEGNINGVFNGTLRPLQATRGHLVDASVEQQFGPRFAVRTNLFYKKLKNFGDSGVVQNTPLYNRFSFSAQEAYGLENRIDLKPARDGYGFNGFVSNTIAVALLRGTKGVTGGIYEIEEEPSTTNYPDHDRRMAMTAALGYRARSGIWTLGSVQVLTGLKNSLDPLIFGPQTARTPTLTTVGLNMGYDVPKHIAERNRALPSSFDVRIENMLNQRKPINLGSPYQGTRYQLPFRLLAGMYWKV
jgi:hypothetical protein